MGRGAKWRADAGIDPAKPTREAAAQMVQGYLSKEHLGDLDGQCPMIALPSDAARSSPDVQAAYQLLLDSMVRLFETSLTGPKSKRRQTALSLAALCVGGMVLARTLDDPVLADDLRGAARRHALSAVGGEEGSA